MVRRTSRRSRVYSGARRTYSRARRGIGSSLSLSTPFLIGAALGITNLDDKIPKDITLVAATAPVRGLGSLKAGAQGIILGNIIQHFTGFRTGSASGPSGVAQLFNGF